MKDWSALFRGWLSDGAPAGPGSPLSVRELYAGSAQATVILDAERLLVLAANPAAASALGVPEGTVTGAPLTRWLAAAAEAPFAAAARAAVQAGGQHAVATTSASGGRRLQLLVSAVTTAEATFVIVAVNVDGLRAASDSTLGAIARSSDAFVLTDAKFRIRYANDAFARLVGAGGQRLAGQALERWLVIGPDGLARLDVQRRHREAATWIPATLRASVPDAPPLAVLSVSVAEGPDAGFGLLIRASTGIDAAGPHS